MLFGKSLMALSVAAMLTACGGGGGDSPSELTVDLSALVGTDLTVYSTSQNTCTGSLSSVSKFEVTKVGAKSLNILFTNSSNQQGTFSLNYISGDNVSGYKFSGSASDTTGSYPITSAIFINKSTSGSLNIAGGMTVILGNCTSNATFS